MLITTLGHIVFSVIYNTHPGVDGVIYQRIAGEILDSGSVAACGTFAGAYWPPLFCYYLALFWLLFGKIQWLFFLFNIVIALTTALISKTYLTRIFGERIGLWSTLFFYNSMIVYYFTVYYKYELITGLLIACSLTLILRANAGRVGLLSGGVCLGLATLATGRVLSLLPALMYYIFAADRQQTRLHRAFKAALLVLGIVLVISPWTLRNYYCLERFVPITTNSGINFYMGFNESADGSFLHQFKFPEPYKSLDRSNNKKFYEGGLNYIISNPSGAVVLMIRKLNILWRIHYADMLFFYPFFYIGIFMMRRKLVKTDKTYARTVQMSFLLYTAFHLLFIARHYYILPLLPLVYGVAVSTQKMLLGKLRRFVSR